MTNAFQPAFANVAQDAGSDDPGMLRRFTRELARGLRGTALIRILDPNGDGSYAWSATANAASTVLTDKTKRLWGYGSGVLFIPMTANADAVASPYVTQANLLPGTMTITHVNNANADKTYRIVVIG